jgi:hypothetical protein
LDEITLPGTETMERFRHEIIANSQAGQRAFDAFDD